LAKDTGGFAKGELELRAAQTGLQIREIASPHHGLCDRGLLPLLQPAEASSNLHGMNGVRMDCASRDTLLSKCTGRREARVRRGSEAPHRLGTYVLSAATICVLPERQKVAGADCQDFRDAFTKVDALSSYLSRSGL